MVASMPKPKSCPANCAVIATATGFTLIELSVVVSLIAILSFLAAPSMRELLANQRVQSAATDVFTAFVRALLDGSRDDHELTRAEWLAELTRVSRDPGLARDIVRLVDEGAADPKALLASLLTRAGVPFTRGPDGVPRLS